MGNPRFGRMIPAMVTPMKDNLDLDLDRAQELADRLVKGGADSLIINGTTGESPTVFYPDKIELFKAVNAPCIVYGEVGRSIQGDRSKPLATKPRLSDDEMKAYGRKLTAFGEWCAEQGMPLAYHHHMAAAIETEPELDLFMKHSSVPLLFDAGHMAFAGGDVMRVIETHHARITHVHTKDIRRAVVDALDRGRESFLDAVIKGAFTVPGDGSLDFEAIVTALAAKGYEGWFVVEAEQDPEANPPLEMAQKGHRELLRVMAAAGYEVIGAKVSQ